jgi:preprotein translocase subunit SecD
MSIREVMDNGHLAARPFIRPEHVARLDAAPKLFPEEDPAVFVTLTAQGEKRMLSHTENSIGKAVAAFCGNTEISRATITRPFGNNFRVFVRVPGGT